MRWVIIGLCFLANAINFIDRANLAIAAPHIRAELALDPTTMGVIMCAFFWKYALCQIAKTVPPRIQSVLHAKYILLIYRIDKTMAVCHK